MQMDFSLCGAGKHLAAQSLGGPSRDVSICPFLCCKCSSVVKCEVTGYGARKGDALWDLINHCELSFIHSKFTTTSRGRSQSGRITPREVTAKSRQCVRAPAPVVGVSAWLRGSQTQCQALKVRPKFSQEQEGNCTHRGSGVPVSAAGQFQTLHHDPVVDTLKAVMSVRPRPDTDKGQWLTESTRDSKTGLRLQ